MATAEPDEFSEKLSNVKKLTIDSNIYWFFWLYNFW